MDSPCIKDLSVWIYEGKISDMGICLVPLSAATTNTSSLQIPAAFLPHTPTPPKCYDRGRDNSLTSGYYHTFTPESVPLVSQIL